ncbi:hypothetical protein D9611_009691 [Ephemerocybe angulata]|uniref:WD40 repeat-like protein n=1 Tax=Ephemerocybe angulata TaxID=980116 RepID=A0A8H5C5U7_9AGAR|nr:hypothetical protein D9611_009691 [Tulosesus angulatus]
MAQPRRRVSFVVPPPTTHVTRLRLPAHGMQRLGATGPLLVPYETQDTPHVEETPPWARHPRHRLGISSLALDISTQLAGQNTPGGILYSGGRDGLIIAWDLGVPMKKRRTKLSVTPSRKNDHWEYMTGWADDAIEEEGEEDDRVGTDGDVLGDVTSSLKRSRQASVSGETPIEQQWEADMASFRPGSHSEFRQCAQAHSDWINDILLCNHNQTVISASSDGTIKSWNPHAPVPSDPSVIGSHTDYVRCLSLCREQNWVASGSFDRTIKLWDISRSGQSDPLVTLNPADASAPKSSVYAIASDPFGRTIASGSPERVVRMWDPRSAKRTGKLVGHTDNIRAILISDDSKYLLTGSADASIKLWSLTSQRCLHTFTHHAESVWSLYSTHPNLETFYSGDRCGLVCRVDVEGCGDLSDGECVLLCNDTGDAPRPAMEGINRLAVLNDSLLWTATGTSTIKRWHIPPKRAHVPSYSQYDADGERFSPAHSPNLSPAKRRIAIPHELASEASTRPSTGHGSRERGHSIDATYHGVPFDSLVKLLSPNDPFTPITQGRNRDPEVATLYSAASIMSVQRGNSSRMQIQSSFQNTHGSPLQSSRTEDTMMATNVARANYEERELASEATPYCSEPDDVLVGEDGLVRSVILNDRVHALTVDTSGEVAVWDIVRGLCLGRYLADDVASASHSGSVDAGNGESERSPREALEAVRERIEGEAVVSTWCTADTKAGVLAIHLTDRCFDAEVYADEVGFSHDDKYFNDESKLNIGKWVLRNLFFGFIREELHLKKVQESPVSKDGFLPPSVTRGADRTHVPPPESPRKPRHRPSSSVDSNRRRSRNGSSSTAVIHSPKMIPAIPPVITSFPRSSPLLTPLIPLIPAKEMLPPILQSPVASPGEANPQTPSASNHQRSRSGTVDGYVTRTPSTGAGTVKDDYFTLRTRQQSLPVIGFDETPATPGTPRAEPPTPSTPGGLMGRLKNFGKIAKRPVSDAASPTLGALTPTAETLAAFEDITPEVPKTPMQQLLAGPLTPPGNVDAPLHAFPPQTVVLITEEAAPAYRVVYRGHVASIHHDTAALEEVMPMWLAEYLLLSKVPPSAPLAKFSFILLPWNKDPDVEPLPELLNTAQSKLTASRYLRVAKILQHVYDKLEKVAASESSKVPSVRSSLDANHPQSTSTESSSGLASRPRPEDQYEILCSEALLPLDMTLAAVRQYVWRQSGELVMHYRRKVHHRDKVGAPF